MSNWLVHSSGPWKKHKYKSRSGSPGNYSYVYPKGPNEHVKEAGERAEEADQFLQVAKKWKATKQQAADERAYKERMKETFNLPTSGKSRAQRAQNNAASQRLAAQQAGKEWQENQAKKRKEAARDKELRSGLNTEQKKRRNDAASKARKASEKRRNNERAMEQDRIRHIESIKKRDRKNAIENVVRSFTKKKKTRH